MQYDISNIKKFKIKNEKYLGFMLHMFGFIESFTNVFAKLNIYKYQ